jgi:hypothetical protein
VWRAFGVQPLMQNRRVVLALGVTYLGVDPGVRVDPTYYEQVRDGDQPVYRLRGALGRVYAVPEVVDLGSDTRVLAGMQTAGFDPSRVALTRDPAAAGIYPGSARSRTQWIEDGPDRLALDIEAPAPAFLVVADSNFPGWTATLDGRWVPIHLVNHLLRGVAVPAGRHRLAMAYEPEGWRAGATSTRAALLMWMVLAVEVGVWMVKARRRLRAPHVPAAVTEAS